jgi:predicted O-linked N-acetylglucosamine transferase (SPINDLY family)
MPDEALARLVREDTIDILVDLCGHTAYQRLPAFALKPAPLQMTWLGFPTTVGLPAIDFRISSPEVDPPGHEHYNTEGVLRLPGSYFCFRPGPAPGVGPLPAGTDGPVTFGSYNALPKISDRTVALWAAVLHAVPGSRLALKNRSLDDPRVQERVRRAFGDAGIPAGRLEFVVWAPSGDTHLEGYNRIDIALDTFPYNGATTTCEALWMGVPVVSLCGETHASRMGRSILAATGLSELVAETDEDFVAIAADLARNRTRLADLRANLRTRLQPSPLLAEGNFTRGLEALYRSAWRRWCFAHA